MIRMLYSKSTTFEPVHPFNLEDPKTWAETVGRCTSVYPQYHMSEHFTASGSLDWDKTHVCFTKRSLLEFLKWAPSPCPCFMFMG
jgi:hypothetical protein